MVRVKTSSARATMSVWVFLVEHDHVGGVDGGLGDVAVQVEFYADLHPRADDLAHALGEVGLAVVIPIGDHCPVQEQQDDIERTGGPQAFEQFIPERFVGGAGRCASRLGEGVQAKREIPTLIGGHALPGADGIPAEDAGQVVEGPGDGEVGQAGGDGREGVGFGGDAATEDAHERRLSITENTQAADGLDAAGAVREPPLPHTYGLRNATGPEAR